MCPMRIFLFLGSLIIIGFSMWIILSDDQSEGIAAIKRKDQSWVRHRLFSSIRTLTTAEALAIAGFDMRAV
jgi:hypothetical protein